MGTGRVFSCGLLLGFWPGVICRRRLEDEYEKRGISEEARLVLQLAVWKETPREIRTSRMTRCTRDRWSEGLG